MRKLLLALLVSGLAMAMSPSAALAGGASDTSCEAGLQRRGFPGLFCFLVFPCSTEKGEDYFAIAMGCQRPGQGREMQRWLDDLFVKYVDKDGAECSSPEVFGNFAPDCVTVP